MIINSLNFIVSLGVYPFDVMVSIGESDEEVRKQLENRGINVSQTDFTHSSQQSGRTAIFSENVVLLRIYNSQKSAMWHGVLAHEIFHASEFVLERIGMRLTLDSDEAYAYLIGYLTEKIYEKIL